MHGGNMKFHARVDAQYFRESIDRALYLFCIISTAARFEKYLPLNLLHNIIYVHVVHIYRSIAFISK